MTSEQQSSQAQAERLVRAVKELNNVLREPTVAERLRVAPSEADWSAMQVLGHVVEMMPYWIRQCEIVIAAQDAPPPFGRTLEDGERLAGVERGAMGDADELLRVMNVEVVDTAYAIRNMSDQERAKVGVHHRRGEMTVEQIIETFIVAHAEDHLAQVRAVLGN